eukprot:6779171-Pyramimonas_sp.AAC.1
MNKQMIARHTGPDSPAWWQFGGRTWTELDVSLDRTARASGCPSACIRMVLSSPEVPADSTGAARTAPG